MREPVPVVLASASPRREALLKSIGIAPTIIVPEFDETQFAGETPEELVRRLAHGKAASVLARGMTVPEALVIAADTVVVIDDAVLGKPGSPEAAASMLGRLSGRMHRVLTGLAVMRYPLGQMDISHAETRVFFRNLDADQISAYVSREAVESVAGAYRIQDLGALLVEHIEGSWSNVVGLPLELLFERALRQDVHLL